MKSIFLADTHLRNPDESSYRELINFFEQLPDDLDNLFILGDFFDFWHGYPETAFRIYTPILKALKKLVDRDVKIHFFAGNHEISFGPRLMELGSCHAADATIELDGQKLYLAHGDLLNPDDYLYRIWHSLIRSRPILKLADTLPPALTLKIADTLSRNSRKSNKSQKIIPAQILTSCAKILCRKDDIQTVIIAHFHQERQENFLAASGPKALYILGDWANKRSYLLFENGKFSFNSYHP
ncbi:UDP-2,3-diacylglucosamine diphosphatase [bacterium]|nr:UDP-2,3-diacylglucosamine diphosphatase [bacterium]